MLSWTVYSSFLGAALLLALPAAWAKGIRLTALFTALSGLFCAWGGAVEAKTGMGIVTVAKVDWIPALGIQYFLGADGISLAMVVLTGLAAVGGVLFSWNIEYRLKEFFALFFVLIGGVYGVFLSFDLFLLFVFYEIAIIPKYFIVAIWGSTRKEYGAMKLVLYSFVGSALVLVGMIAAYVVGGAETGVYTFDLIRLAQVDFPLSFQNWVFPLVFIGFAILAGLWPFHTWAPTGHVAAPTAASMLLAGVVMKLGAYGCLRVAMSLFPQGLETWRYAIAVLAVIGIVYGALVALTQQDFKFVIGYSSVSHMGFVILGLMTLNEIGLSGAVLQMFSHGIIAGLLFAVVGRMVYDRAHTRMLGELEVMQLGRAIPFAGFTFVVAGLASMGMPGFSGFIAELKVLIGAWKAFPTLAIISGVGILVGVAYTLSVVHRAFYSQAAFEINTVSAGSSPMPMAPITVPEKLGALMLMACTLFIGVYPDALLDWIIPALQSPMFEGLRRSAGWQ